MFHRIAQVASDPWGMCVSPVRFEQQLAVLRKFGFSLTSLNSIQPPLVPRADKKCAVVTFDDGYVDNFMNARLILEAYQAHFLS
jgi:peptidoglycan/xylan/chitin deacetylase (PgdA/CDA1 family)